MDTVFPYCICTKCDICGPGHCPNDHFASWNDAVNGITVQTGECIVLEPKMMFDYNENRKLGARHAASVRGYKLMNKEEDIFIRDYDLKMEIFGYTSPFKVLKCPYLNVDITKTFSSTKYHPEKYIRQIHQMFMQAKQKACKIY